MWFCIGIHSYVNVVLHWNSQLFKCGSALEFTRNNYLNMHESRMKAPVTVACVFLRTGGLMLLGI